MLVAGCAPLRLYLFRDGLVRFATEKYERANSQNKSHKFKHLTNYAINKLNANFVVGEELNAPDGHEQMSFKRSIEDFFAELAAQGFRMEIVWKQIRRICTHTVVAIQPILKHSYQAAHTDDPYNQICFEILGLDILLDNTLKPFLLEVNHAPSFACDSPVDQAVKKKLVQQSFELLDLSRQERTRLAELKSSNLRQTSMQGRRSHLAQGEFFAKCSNERTEQIDARLKDYERLYPPRNREDADALEPLFHQAELNYRAFTGADTASKKESSAKEKMGVSNTNILGPWSSTVNSFDHLERIYGNRHLKSLAKKVKKSAQATSPGRDAAEEDSALPSAQKPAAKARTAVFRDRSFCKTSYAKANSRALRVSDRPRLECSPKPPAVSLFHTKHAWLSASRVGEARQRQLYGAYHLPLDAPKVKR